MLPPFLTWFHPGTRSCVLCVVGSTQGYVYSQICHILKTTRGDSIAQSYLSKACHLLPVPASFRQGVDGHLAGLLGITRRDGTGKCRTEALPGARATECTTVSFFFPHQAVRCLARAPGRIRGDYSISKWFSTRGVVSARKRKTTVCLYVFVSLSLIYFNY